MGDLERIVGAQDFTFPIGIFLVLDEANGGDSAAWEIVRRKFFLRSESKDFIDFYYFGWKETLRDGWFFSLSAFQDCRAALTKAGIKKFGGNADLILLDVEKRGDDFLLRFDQALSLDLSKMLQEGHIVTVGNFLQALVETTREVLERDPTGCRGLVAPVSDSMGIAVAKESLLDFVLKKWGEAIGGAKLLKFCTRSLGPQMTLDELSDKVTSK
jgi:hypothetical protein